MKHEKSNKTQFDEYTVQKGNNQLITKIQTGDKDKDGSVDFVMAVAGKLGCVKNKFVQKKKTKDSNQMVQLESGNLAEFELGDVVMDLV